MCYYSVVAASAVVEVAFVAAVTVAVAIDTAFVAAPYSFDVVVAEHSSAAVIADSACSFVAVVAGSGNLQ